MRKGAEILLNPTPQVGLICLFPNRFSLWTSCSVFCIRSRITALPGLVQSVKSFFRKVKVEVKTQVQRVSYRHRSSATKTPRITKINTQCNLVPQRPKKNSHKGTKTPRITKKKNLAQLIAIATKEEQPRRHEGTKNHKEKNLVQLSALVSQWQKMNSREGTKTPRITKENTR